MDGYQQLVRDFATWRVLNAAEAREQDPGKRAWYREDRLRREALILRDMGYLSHYVGDGAQPLHTSIHYNGWGRDSEPRGLHHLAPDPRAVRGGLHGAGGAAGRGRGGHDGAGAWTMFDLRLRVPAYLKTSLAEVTALLSAGEGRRVSSTATRAAGPL